MALGERDLEMEGEKKSRVFVFGVDGATFDRIKPWVKEGKLPNFKRVMEEGVYGELESPFPALTPKAWSCFLTGKNAGKHGLYYYTERVPGSYKLRYVNAKARDGRTIHRILSDHGRCVGMLNVPMTFPPEQVNGFVISGIDAPSTLTDFTYPKELKAEIKKIISDYTIDLRLKGSMDNSKRDYVLEELVRMETDRAVLFKHLMKRYPWDFLMTVFIATDRVQHHFWRYMDPEHEDYNVADAQRYGDAILNIYRLADKTLGTILASLDDNDRLVIMSDHGLGRATNKVFYPNKWLAEMNLLKLKDKGQVGNFDGRLALSPRKIFFRGVRGTKRMLMKRLSPKGKEFVLQFLPKLRGRVQSFILFSKIDWSQTKAFSDEILDGIWINVKGREPEGIVEPGTEYEALRDSIIEELYKVKDPETGDRVIEKVYKREELYHGPHLERAPDLSVRFKDFIYRMRPSNTTIADSRQGVLGKVSYEGRTSGCHYLNGILLLWGKGFQRGVEIQDAKIVDVTPTILHTMGLSIPDDMDGRVLTEAFENPAPPTYVKSDGREAFQSEAEIYSNQESELIQDRLKGLGYIE